MAELSKDPNVIDIFGDVSKKPRENYVVDPAIEPAKPKKAKISKRSYKPKTLTKLPDSPEVKAIKAQTEIGKDQVEATDDLTRATEAQTEFDKKSGLYIAAANFALSVYNANSAYASQNTAAQLNIMEARRLGNDALERGKQRALEAQAEGILAGDQTALSLAAQGQDLSGASAQKVIGSLEDIGLYNAMQEEVDSITESLGYDLEEVSIGFQLDQAEIERDSTIISAGLNLGASAFSSTL